MKEQQIPTPFYIVYEERLRRNLELIADVERRSGATIIMAFKANALWKTFPVIREYNRDFTASSISELRLGLEELGGRAHSYTPAYTDATIDEFLAGSSHITFNSLTQYARYADRVARSGASAGLRVNPHCTVVETDIYNPMTPGSRLGVSAASLGDTLPAGIEGLHVHGLCESDSNDLERLLGEFERQFGRYIDSLKWVNLGGGHLMTRQGYDTEHLIGLIRDFKARHPGVEVILEPGSAWTWQTGDLIVSVADVVTEGGINTAIIDASFACHMPDCLEMPYQPRVAGSLAEAADGGFTCRLGGNSCLAGDWVGDWHFPSPLKPGDRLRLEDMNHYTTVKTTMFNGVAHPSIVWCDNRGDCRVLREFGYDDYKNRMD